MTGPSRLIAAALALASFACASAPPEPTGDPGNRFEQKILVANRRELAPDALIDPRLINPWGIALRPPGAGGHIWVSNFGSLSTSTYVGDVNGVPLHQDGLNVSFTACL